MNGTSYYLINEINKTDEEIALEYATSNDETRKLIDESSEELIVIQCICYLN